MGFELERLRPANAPCALIEWPLPADEAGVDGPIGPEAVAILTRAMLRSGNVAFRYDHQIAGANGRFYPEPAVPAARQMLNTLLDRGGPENFGVMTASDEETAAALFEWGGWSVAAQAAISYDPTADIKPIVKALQHGLDWRERSLPDGWQGSSGLEATTATSHWPSEPRLTCWGASLLILKPD